MQEDCKAAKGDIRRRAGDQDACLSAKDAFCSAWVPAMAARRRVAYYTSTQEIQLFQGTSHHLVEQGSLYVESLDVPNRTTLPVLSPIFANDIGSGRVYAILSSMLAVWPVDFDAMTVWEHGCSLTDNMLQVARGVDALEDREITVCPGTGACTLHLCPNCLRARRCQDF